MTNNKKLTKESIKELINILTLEQKVKLCSGKNLWYLEDFEELGIPGIMVADGPHGLRKQVTEVETLGIADSVPSTCFPTAATLACSWDRELVFEVGNAIGEMCRQEKVSVLLGPGINIKRSPLCGRNFEYYSEDPYLTGEMATAFIKGVQNQGIGTSLKHFAVNNQEYHRMVFDSIIDERTLREIYLTGFEMAVKNAQPWTMMTGYNRINGIFCSDNHRLLTKILREEWGFNGVVMSDWGGTNDRVAGIKAGMDLEMPSSGGAFDDMVKESLENGTLSIDDLNKSIERLLNLVKKSQAQLDGTYLCDMNAHHRLARKAAAESAVLLKNEGNLLPLKKDIHVAIVGDMAKNLRYQGHGSSLINPDRLETAMDEISRFIDREAVTTYAQGYLSGTDKTDTGLLKEAVTTATNADVAIVFVGLPPIFESEGYDREHMAMPANHIELIEEIAAVNDNVVVVLSNGSPIELPWIDKVKSVLETYLGGQASGGAVTDVLFGVVNPSGKLAETFPMNGHDTATYRYFPGESRQVQYREGLYVGYRYFDTVGKEVRFPFGHGLSYTTFEYSNFSLSKAEITDAESVIATVTVTNTGNVAGYEIVQCYVHDLESSVYRPEQELKNFAKVYIQPGESREITMVLDRRSFAFYDVNTADWQVETGEFEIRLGSSSRDIKLRRRLTVTSNFSFTGSPSPDEYRLPLKEHFTISDDAFTELVGQPVPPVDPVYPFHINSTMGEIKDTFFGRIIYKRARKAAFKVWKGEMDDTTKKIIEIGLLGSPLRSLVLLTGGKFSFSEVQGLITILNGRFFKGLGMVLGLIRNK